MWSIMTEKKRLKSSRYISGIDGIRSLAVIGVVLYHLSPSFLKGGYLGVVLFFVISGYLITDLLFQELYQNKRLDYKGFFKRRIKRLYPTLAFVLLLASAYITLFQRNLLNNIRGVIWSSLLNVNNWWQIHKGFSYFDRFQGESPFTHIWALSIEWQFYLLWPFLFLILVKGIRKKKIVNRILIGAALLSAILMAFLFHPAQDPSRVYYGTDTRLFSILIGCLLAFVWPTYRLKPRIPRGARLILEMSGIVSLGLLLWAFVKMDASSTFTYRGGMFLISLCTAVLVAVTAHPGARMNRWLTNPLFSWIGKRSYGLYLYQLPVMVFYEAKVQNLADHPWMHSLIEVFLLVLLSELSYRFIERPAARADWLHASLRIVRSMKQGINVHNWAAIPILILLGTSIVGWASAPTNHVTKAQKEVQETIAENKKALESKAPAQKTEKTLSSSEEQTISSAYNLTPEQLKKADKMKISALGDSVLLGSAAEIKQIFPQITMDGSVGRQVYEAPAILETMKSSGGLANTVIIALGTNGSFTQEQFAEVMKSLSGKKVYWVNAYVPTQKWQNQVNQSLAAWKKDYKNLTIIDWYSVASAHPEWFEADHVHPNVDGRKSYAGLIAKEILK